MKNRLFFPVVSILAFLALFPSVVIAAPFVRGDKNIVLAKGVVIDGNYLAAGNTVTLSGTVNGDAYVAGGNVIIDGVVNGDLLAAGGTITINGTVRDDIRAAGGQVTVSGQVGRNLTLAGGAITITSNADIQGSLVAGTGNLAIFAPIGSEMTVGAGQLTIGSSVNGDVLAGVGQLSLTPGASISGNLTYYSEEKADISNGATVSGTVEQRIPPKVSQDQTKIGDAAQAAGKFFLFAKIVKFFAALIVGLILIRLAPLFVRRASDVVESRPFASLGIGFLILIIVPVVSVVLLFTLIGIPLGLLSLAMLVISSYFAKYFIAVVLGDKTLGFFNSTPSLAKSMLLGLLMLELIGFVPILGGIVGFVVFLIGLGALAIAKKNFYKQLREKKLI